MAGNDTRRFKIKQYIESLPGGRGDQIPTHIYDRIFDVARGVTEPMWGRPPTPHQMQWLYDNGHHDAASIHGAFGKLPHPHAPNVTVDEYPAYERAHQVFTQHR